MRWAEIEAIVSDEAADMVSNIYIEEGCGGVAITGPSVIASDTAEAPADEPGPEQTTIKGYLPVDDSLEGRLDRLTERIRELPESGIDVGPCEITVRRVEESDWASAWRSFFKPVEVGNVLIRPSWEEIEAKPGQIVVDIDPGMAFGTGNHPTTQLCIELLQKYVKGGERMLDAGTGSAILSIAAAKLGVADIIATEIDSVAVESAIKNAEYNGVSSKIKVFHTGSPASVTDKVDLAVANIIADIIIKLSQEFADVVVPGGIIILSGVITARADEVVACMEGKGFDFIEKTTDDDWVAIVMRRK